MHHARNSPVEKTVTRLERRYEKRTSRIVFSATGVSHAETAEIGVFGSTVTTAAPLRPWYHEQISTIPAPIPILLSMGSVVCRHVRRSRIFPVLQNNFSSQ